MLDFVEHFYELRPTLNQWLMIGLPTLVVAQLALSFAGYLRKRKVKTGYTRKVFHFIIFCSAAPIQAKLGFSGLFAFGFAVSAVVFYAVLRGERSWAYKALAREKDAPHETRYIIIPWLATALGGLFANYFAGPYAIVGYLVAGIGDAVGEPVGTRWGKMIYTTPNFSGITSYRSVEGSFGVFIGSTVGVFLGFYLIGALPEWHMINVMLFVGLCFFAVVLEAMSPHGWDNFTMMLGPALLAQWWFVGPI